MAIINQSMAKITMVKMAIPTTINPLHPNIEYLLPN